MIQKRLFAILAVGLVLSIISATVFAAANALQKKRIADLTEKMQKAGELFGEKKFDESAKVIQEVQREYGKLVESSDPEVVGLLEPIYSRLVKAHARLELEGFDFPRLKKPEASTEVVANTTKPASTKSNAKSNPANPAAGNAMSVSFVKQVVPMLVVKCGRCHVDNARGNFSMANFAQLMKGSDAGVVIFPGDDKGSRLIEVIETGDMPRGGAKLTPDEFAMLKKWVKDGAKFDGTNDQESLRSLAPGAMPAEPQSLAVVNATGNETVSFAKDIAPVLVKNCNGCHVDAQRVRGNLNMSSFTGLLKGGDGGPPIAPGKSADSLLVKRIKGEGGDPRMPMGRPALADDVISKMEKWIAEGAKFDGGDPSLNIGQLAALARAQSATHEELTAERLQLAEQNWRLGLPNIEFTKFETPNFLLLGNVGEETLKDLGTKVEAVRPRIAKLFEIPSDQPMVKGRMTIFIFGQRYDYAEFGQMVEKRQLPQEWRGHWRFTIVDAYAAINPSRSDEYSFDALVGQQIAGTYVASLGKGVPHWFSEGSARVTASRIASKDPRVFGWETELSSVLGSMTKADDFMTGKLKPEFSDIASYSFVRFLMRNAGTYNALLNALRSGKEFDKAFVEIYKAKPSDAAEIWVATAAKTVKRKK